MSVCVDEMDEIAKMDSAHAVVAPAQEEGVPLLTHTHKQQCD